MAIEITIRARIYVMINKILLKSWIFDSIVRDVSEGSGYYKDY